ncbi:hypothetical protein [uncultured Sulfitobacter sp.]|uniref:hypothetical protein n=1 Tax=Sulfitobacter sp. SH22 TaxID=3421172 RepID=UPI0025DBF6DE|nr:hypothetical protein [uncultured Sulfitobacter sp.]
MGPVWYAFLLRLIGRRWQQRADKRRPDSLRRDVSVRLNAPERTTFIHQLGAIARAAEGLLASARQENATSGGSTEAGPAMLAAQRSSEVAVFQAITALRQDWLEPRSYSEWTDRQMRSAQLLISYGLEANEKRAASYLATVEDVTFFRRWRNVIQAAVKSAKRAADRATFEAGYDARTAKLRAVWDKARNDRARKWSGVAAELRVPVPETPFRTLLERAAPDPWLWHTIATDQHELTADRAAAIFWLLDRPECDRATVAEFIAGFLMSENYLRAAQNAAKGTDVWQFSAFADLMAGWNRSSSSILRISRGDVGMYNEDGPFLTQMTDDRILLEFAAVHQKTGMPFPEVPQGLSRSLEVAPPETTLSKTGPITYNSGRNCLVNV